MKFCNCFKNFCNENAISILISNIIQAESELCTYPTSAYVQDTVHMIKHHIMLKLD